MITCCVQPPRKHALNTGPESDLIVIIEAGGLCSSIYGVLIWTTFICRPTVRCTHCGLVFSALVSQFATFNFLLFVFFISLVHHHHPVLDRHALILAWLLTSLMAFPTLVLTPSFPQSLALSGHLCLAQAVSWDVTTQCLSIAGGGSTVD